MTIILMKMLRSSCIQAKTVLKLRFTEHTWRNLSYYSFYSTGCKECQRQFTSSDKNLKKFRPQKIGNIFSINRCLSSQIPPADSSSQSSKLEDQSDKTLADQTGQSSNAVDPETSPVEGGEDLSDPKATKKIVKIKKKKPFDNTYLDNIYVEPGRALVEYMLTVKELESLTKYSRRSPYGFGSTQRMIVYKKKDVEDLAILKHGSLENLTKLRMSRNQKELVNRKLISQVKMMISDQKERARFNKTYGLSEDNFGEPIEQEKSFFTNFYEFCKTGSGRVVVSAIIANLANAILKLIAWMQTGSHSMFSEFLHSVADTLNQILLAAGLFNSHRKPDLDHPYGYSNLRHVSSLISGVGIFCLGTGLSIYHGVQGILHPQEMWKSLFWVIGSLSGSFLSESASLTLAILQVKKRCRLEGLKFWEYVSQGRDPNVIVVLLEDLAAISGVTIAASCIALTHFTGITTFDAAGSIMIGGLLGIVAGFIIKTNSAALLIRSIPLEKKNEIRLDLEKDRMIRSLHDIKATEMGGEWKFKAEVDFDGKEITRAYLYKLDLEQLLKEMKGLQNSMEAEEFMLKHGGKLIDSLGEEIDRIEKLIKIKHPEIRHMDLEAL